MEHQNKDDSESIFSKKSDNTPWYLREQFGKYWNLYFKCMSYAARPLNRNAQYSGVKYDISKTLQKIARASSHHTFRRRVSKRRSNKKRRKKKRKQNNKRQKPSDSVSSMFVLTDDDTLQVHMKNQLEVEECEDMEEEFFAFMETSVKHRIKWNEIKESKKEKHTSNLMYSETSEEEHPDTVRSKEMQHLYGDLSAKIIGMETAMQLSFDRLSTLHQPTLWPNIPLKLSFG